MRILAVHNRYLISGGEDQSHLAEVALLRELGFQVDEYLEDNQRIAKLGAVRTALKTIWSQETYKRIGKILEEAKYDLVLVQNFFPLISPSVFFAAKRRNVPVILTLRNFRLFCLNGFALLKDTPCVQCLGKTVPWPGVLHACYRGNHFASSVVASMLVAHRLVGTWNKAISHYIVLNQFSYDLFKELGLPDTKLHIKPNFILSDPGIGNGSEAYVLYAGRLSREKGIELLLSAWESGKVNLPLLIVGNGPLRFRVENAASTNRGIQYLGEKSQAEVLTLLKNAIATIFPSIWYEGMPRIVLESFAVGTPVLASHLGSMKTMIKHGVNGYFFEPNNADDLLAKLVELCTSPGLYRDIRDTTRMDFEKNYSASANKQSWKELFVKLRLPGSFYD